MLQKMRDLKKSRRGFTLVEIIVVLVILAILAAFTIPAMLGYINSAREKAHLAEARACLIATQATIDEYSQKDGKSVDFVVKDLNAHNDTNKTGAYDAYKAYIGNDVDVAKLVATDITVTAADANGVGGGKVNAMVLTNSDAKYKMTYDGTSWKYTVTN